MIDFVKHQRFFKFDTLLYVDICSAFSEWIVKTSSSVEGQEAIEHCKIGEIFSRPCLFRSVNCRDQNLNMAVK